MNTSSILNTPISKFYPPFHNNCKIHYEVNSPVDPNIAMHYRSPHDYFLVPKIARKLLVLQDRINKLQFFESVIGFIQRNEIAFSKDIRKSLKLCNEQINKYNKLFQTVNKQSQYYISVSNNLVQCRRKLNLIFETTYLSLTINLLYKLSYLQDWKINYLI